MKDIPVGAAQLAYKGWVLPMPYYVVRFKEAALVCLDTNSMADAEGVKPMAAWLQKTKANLANNGRLVYQYGDVKVFYAFGNFDS